MPTAIPIQAQIISLQNLVVDLEHQYNDVSDKLAYWNPAMDVLSSYSNTLVGNTYNVFGSETNKTVHMPQNVIDIMKHSGSVGSWGSTTDTGSWVQRTWISQWITSQFTEVQKWRTLKDTLQGRISKAKGDLGEALLHADTLNQISLTAAEKMAIATSKAENLSLLQRASGYAQNHRVIIISITVVILILVSLIVVKKFILK